MWQVKKKIKTFEKTACDKKSKNMCTIDKHDKNWYYYVL